jgi:hypothetical protein
MARAAEGELPLEISWNAPASCPTAADVSHRVRELLSGTPPEGTKVVADAHIRPTGDSWLELVLTTEVAEARGTKTVSARSCDALAEAAAVFIALAIDAAKDVVPPAEAAPDVTPAPELPPPSAEKRARPPRVAPQLARHEPLRFGGGGSGLLDVGTLPSEAIGLGLNVHLRYRRVRVGALGTVWHAQKPVFNAERGAGASVDLMTAGLFGCYVVPLVPFAPLTPLAVGGCANVELTFAEAIGTGIRRPMHARSVWPTVATGILAELPLSRWLSVVARVDLLTAIVAPDMALATDQGKVSLFDPSIFSMRSGAGFEIVLP